MWLLVSDWLVTPALGPEPQSVDSGSGPQARINAQAYLGSRVRRGLIIF